MSAFQIFTQPSQQALDTAANVLSGATLTFTLTGTSTPTNAFSDSALTTPVANPLSANSAGVFAPIFLDPTVIYKIVLKTQAGAVLQTWDPANEQLLTQALIGFYLFPRTAAEIAAGVTPVNYAYNSARDIRRLGAVDDNSTDNVTAINLAISLGGAWYFPASNTGIYRTSGAHTMADGVSFYGDGMRTGQPYGGSGLKYTGTGTMLTMVARNTIRDMELSTTGSAAPAGGATVLLSVGTGAVNAGNCKVIRVRAVNAHIGLQNGGALWLTVQDCALTNNDFGLAFNMSGATTSNACTYIGNEIGFNGRGGVIGLAVPVRMNGQTFIGGSIEGNCQENTATYPDQVNMGAVAFFGFRNVYFEYAAGGTPPNTLNLQSAGNGCVEDCFFNTGATHIRDSVGGAASQIRILNNRMAGATVADINLASETDIIAWGNLTSSTITLTGTGCRSLPTGSALASWPNLGTSFTPTIKGAGTAGTPTYTVQTGFYSKVGNSVTFSIRISITAKGGMAGNISIEGLPVASASGSGTHVFTAEMQGITVSGGNTYFYAEVAQNTTSILLMQGGSTTSPQLVDTNLAAATTIIISGSYQTAS